MENLEIVISAVVVGDNGITQGIEGKGRGLTDDRRTAVWSIDSVPSRSALRVTAM